VPGVQPGRAAPAEDAAGPDPLAGDPAPPVAGCPDLGEVLRLADQGQITAALRTADALLSSAPFLPAGYVLRATLRQSLGDHERAVQDIQRALLLDRSLAFAHVLAAASRTALGQIRAALHALHNARKVLFAQPADAPVAGTQGVTVSELLSLCEQLERVLMRAQPTKQS
jgi:tetratricopeptide (TPR) repeat protein